MNLTVSEGALVKWTHHVAPKSLPHALQVGEELIKIRQKVSHGDFAVWMAHEINFSPRLAGHYMRLAYFRDVIESKNPKPTTIRAAIAAVRGCGYRKKRQARESCM